MKRFVARTAVSTLGALLVPLGVIGKTPSHEWHDAGRQAFAAGHLGNSGQNLYINRHGEIQTIRRFDVDENGWLDLIFNSTHDTWNALPAVLVTAPAGGTLKIAELTVDGSRAVIAADLNRDGYADLVFTPNQQNVQQQRSSIMIAWGAADGWSSQRLTRQLPVEDVQSVAVGDLNGDGWPDIVALNGEGWLFGQPKGRILRTYWGGPEGFLLTRFQDLGIPGGIQVACGGFGAHREFSVAVLTATTVQYLAADRGTSALHLAGSVNLPNSGNEKTPAKARCLAVQPSHDASGDALFVGTDSTALYEIGLAGQSDEVHVLHAGPATQISVGRLDDDAWPDLAIVDQKLVFPGDTPAANQASVSILWGAQEGFDPAHAAAISIPNAAAAAINDLNGDGHGDLAVSVYQGTQSTKASSLVYLGDGTRRLGTPQPVPTEGATGVAIARVSPQSPPVAVFANSQRGTLDSAVPIRLYWGSAEGFSTRAMVDIPNLSGYKSSLSDLNADGYVDLILINGGDVGEDTTSRAPFAGANIYWGGPEGRIGGPGRTRFDPDRRQVLKETHLGSINVADLNGDGFLDVVLGAFESGATPDTNLVIYYGAAAGFVRENRKVIRVPDRSIGCLIADFNRDGRLDIIVGGYTTNRVFTYWGTADGYSDAHKTVMPYVAPIDLEAADLNHDGWLDLIVGSYEDPVAHHHDTGLSIFWGRAEGWSQADSQSLPGLTPLGIAVADLDGDGYLDIVSPHYHGELSRENLPCYIFWGSAEGYAPLRRTPLIVDSASEVEIADFDRDGKLDLAFAAHSVDPGHHTRTPIYFNDGHRFSSPKVQYLPVSGPHYGWVQDVGNIYDRSYVESFTSATRTWDDNARSGHIAVDAATPFGSSVRIHVRSAGDAKALEKSPWRDVSKDAFDVKEGDRVLAYRLDLVSANGDAYPTIRKVDVTLR